MTIIKTVKVFFVTISVICITACNNSNSPGVDVKSKPDSTIIALYTFPVQHGYGYSIVINEKEFIRQDCIPAIQGNKPFASKEQAEKTGELVAGKIRSGQLPTLTLDELNKLGITQ